MSPRPCREQESGVRARHAECGRRQCQRPYGLRGEDSPSSPTGAARSRRPRSQPRGELQLGPRYGGGVARRPGATGIAPLEPRDRQRAGSPPAGARPGEERLGVKALNLLEHAAEQGTQHPRGHWSTTDRPRGAGGARHPEPSTIESPAGERRARRRALHAPWLGASHLPLSGPCLAGERGYSGCDQSRRNGQS